MAKVVVGLSGGVDSSVTAYLLKEQGHEVIGLFMKNWHDDTVTISDECPWLEDSNDAMLVADKLGIPFQTVDLSKAYKDRIVDYMFDEYARGRTPNPDVLCNREIKFEVFMDIALDLGADFVATGHYCQKQTTIKNGDTIHHLIAGADPGKDQSYFLCQVSQEQLARTLFPIGHLQKKEVREIAATQGLITAGKKDSQGLCFIGKVRLPDFLQQQLKPKTGNIIEIPTQLSASKRLELSGDDEIVSLSRKRTYQESDGINKGQHQGAHYFTRGQRRGLNVGGTPEPLFVIETDVDTNTIYVGQGKEHDGLYRRGLHINIDEIHWIRTDLKLEIGDYMRVMGRIRYRQTLEPVTLHQRADGLYMIFDNPQSAISSGQFAAWYDNSECLGSGVIA